MSEPSPIATASLGTLRRLAASFRSIGLVWISLACAGCASQRAAELCLRTPLSSKVTAAELAPCRKALSAQLDRGDLFEHLAQLLVRQQDYHQLVRWSHEVLAGNRARTDAAYYLAVGLRKLGRCEDAIGFYRFYAKRQSEDPDPHYAIGLCLQDMGDNTGASRAYQTYLEMEQRAAYSDWRRRARERLAALSRTEAPAAKAPAAKTPAAKAPSPQQEPIDARAMRLPTSTEPAAPAPSLPSAPAPQPSPAAEPPASRSHEDCSQHERAVSQDPFATSAYEALARCLAARGAHRLVVRQMRTALRDNPDWGLGWLHLGRSQQAIGQQQAGAASLRKACNSGIVEACP